MNYLQYNTLTEGFIDPNNQRLNGTIFQEESCGTTLPSDVTEINKVPVLFYKDEHNSYIFTKDAKKIQMNTDTFAKHLCEISISDLTLKEKRQLKLDILKKYSYLN